jgi:hypothetical protein
MVRSRLLIALRAFVLLMLIAAPAAAQRRRGPSAQAPAASPTLVGSWSGTATIPLGDSTVVVPVTYTFAQTGDVISGTAVVPGKRSGPIANVVREGRRLRFRVTAPEGKLLEHDGTFGTDGAIEGMVNMDNLPVAKFRIAPRPSTVAPK